MASELESLTVMSCFAFRDFVCLLVFDVDFESD